MPISTRLRFGVRVRLVAASLVSFLVVATPVFDCPAPGHSGHGATQVCPACRGGGEVTGWEYLRYEATRTPSTRSRQAPSA